MIVVEWWAVVYGQCLVLYPHSFMLFVPVVVAWVVLHTFLWIDNRGRKESCTCLDPECCCCSFPRFPTFPKFPPQTPNPDVPPPRLHGRFLGARKFDS